MTANILMNSDILLRSSLRSLSFVALTQADIRIFSFTKENANYNWKSALCVLWNNIILSYPTCQWCIIRYFGTVRRQQILISNYHKNALFKWISETVYFYFIDNCFKKCVNKTCTQYAQFNIATNIWGLFVNYINLNLYWSFVFILKYFAINQIPAFQLFKLIIFNVLTIIFTLWLY